MKTLLLKRYYILFRLKLKIECFIGYYKRFPVQERKWRLAGSKDTQFAADYLKAFTIAGFTRWPLTFWGQSLSVAYPHKNSSFSIHDYLCCPRSNLSSTIISGGIITSTETMHSEHVCCQSVIVKQGCVCKFQYSFHSAMKQRLGML